MSNSVWIKDSESRCLHSQFIAILKNRVWEMSSYIELKLCSDLGHRTFSSWSG